MAIMLEQKENLKFANAFFFHLRVTEVISYSEFWVFTTIAAFTNNAEVGRHFVLYFMNELFFEIMDYVRVFCCCE